MMMNDKKLKNEVQNQSGLGIDSEATRQNISINQNSKDSTIVNKDKEKIKEELKENKIEEKIKNNNKIIENKNKENIIINDNNKINKFINILDFLNNKKNNNISEKDLSSINLNEKIEGLSGDMESIDNYFKKILLNISYNDYYNENGVFEENLCYEFNYEDKNLYSNIKLTELDVNCLKDSEARITSISTKSDNSSWRPNFVNFIYTNFKRDYKLLPDIVAAQIQPLPAENYSITKITETDLETMNAWNNVQALIPGAIANVTNEDPTNYTATSRIKNPGSSSSPIYNINVRILDNENYSVPRASYIAGSTLNKQFLQPNEIFKNTRLTDAQVCNTLDRKIYEFIFGRTQNVGLHYTNKTNQFKLLLYLLMYEDMNNEYLRNYNANNLTQTIAEKYGYQVFNNPLETYYNRTAIKIRWCSFNQYYSRIMGQTNDRHAEYENNEDYYFIPVSLQQFDVFVNTILEIISICPYPLITKYMISVLAFAERYDRNNARYSYNSNYRQASFMTNHININGFSKIVFVIMDLENGRDDVGNNNYLIPIFNGFGVQNRQMINLFNNDVPQNPNQELIIDDIQNIMITDVFKNNYLGNLKNYIINYKRWEIDASILEFAVHITTIYKCNYQQITEYDLHTQQTDGISIANFNFDNETWPLTVNGLQYTNANFLNTKDMSLMFYSDFKSLLCEYTGLITIKRPKISLNILNSEDLQNICYLIRLKSTINSNELLKPRRLCTLPDNIYNPTNSLYNKASEMNIMTMISKITKIDPNFIRPADKYYSIKGEVIHNFYSYVKISTTLNSTIAGNKIDNYDSYIYSTTEKWLKNYFNKNDWIINTLMEQKTINVNELRNNYINLTNIINNDQILRYSLYTSSDIYKKNLENKISDQLQSYIDNCYSIVVERNNNGQRNAGLYKKDKLSMQTIDYDIDAIRLPIINITPFTCYTNINKSFWILSTIGTDYQLIFSDIIFSINNYLNNRISAILFKCNSLSNTMPRFFTGRLLNNMQIRDLDAPQEPDLDEMIEY